MGATGVISHEIAFEMATSSIRYGVGVTREVGMDLADLGVKQALISQYERGSVRLHGALIAGLAKILKASADDLLGLKPAPKNGHATDRRSEGLQITRFDYGTSQKAN